MQETSSGERLATMKEKEKFEFLKLRVLAEYNSTYNTFVARCLETGSVVTADDFDTLKEMMVELLEDEVTYAIEHDNLGNLQSAPAPLDVWIKWQKAAQAGLKNEVLPLNIRARTIRLDEKDVFAQMVEGASVS